MRVNCWSWKLHWAAPKKATEIHVTYKNLQHFLDLSTRIVNWAVCNSVPSSILKLENKLKIVLLPICYSHLRKILTYIHVNMNDFKNYNILLFLREEKLFLNFSLKFCSLFEQFPQLIIFSQWTILGGHCTVRHGWWHASLHGSHCGWETHQTSCDCCQSEEWTQNC